MNKPTRVSLAVVASFASAAYLALVWLTAALGGPWLLVAACIVGLCLLSVCAFLAMAWWAKASADDPTVEPDKDLFDDRNRWAS